MKNVLLTVLTVFVAGIAFGQTNCLAGFNWTHAPQGNNLLRVSFTNASSYTVPPSTASYVSYNLNFGDNSSTGSFFQSTSHNYALPGTYTVVLTMNVYDTVTQNVLCTNAFTQQVTVNYAACGSTISTVNQGGGVYVFTANTPAGTTPMTYTWNFGNGGTGTGSPVTYGYTTSGTYTVTLTATGGGCTYTNTTTVQVGAVAFNCAQAVANFTYTQNNNVVNFINTSTQFNTTPPVTTTANWSFGDGSSSTLKNPQHTYANTGVYSVVLYTQWKDSSTQQVVCSDTMAQMITIGSVPNVISGMIYWDSLNTPPVTTSAFKVWLIEHDAVQNTLTAVDSVSVTGQAFINYSFSGKPAGQYRTKAARQNGTTGVSGLVPTYHDSSLYWNTALVINHAGGTTSGKNVKMKTGIVTSGPGFIGGNISMGANKGTGAGAPDVMVVVRNANNQWVTFTYTDANGDYSFSNLANGTYNVYPEEMNYITTPSSNLVITNGQASVTGIDFEKTSTEIKPKTLGVHGLSATKLFSLSPNPASDNVQIRWTTSQTGSATLQVSDMTGRIVMAQEIQTNQTNSLDLSDVQSGVYFIKVLTDKTQHTEKIILQR